MKQETTRYDRLLIGLHDEALRTHTRMFAERLGYAVTSVNSPQRMLEEVQQGGYTACLMDTNLGSPNAPSADSATRVLEVVRKGAEGELVSFMSISSNPGALAAARVAGTPAESKPFEVMPWLIQSKIGEK